MKIVVDDATSMCKFDELERGQLFSVSDTHSTVYMKMAYCVSNDTGKVVNAIRLSDGELVRYSGDIKVFPLSGELHVHRMSV